MARKRNNNQSRFEVQRQEEANKKLNLSLRMMEKVGLEENFTKQWTDFEVVEPREVTPTFRSQSAPTTNPDRPRALKIAYSREARKLVVKFRDGTWWEYNDIPLRMWVGLKASDSTGKYLKYSGLDTHDDMGPFNPNEMPPEVRVIFNS